LFTYRGGGSGGSGEDEDNVAAVVSIVSSTYPRQESETIIFDFDNMWFQ
jgi:hypothetical protein